MLPSEDQCSWGQKISVKHILAYADHQRQQAQQMVLIQYVLVTVASRHVNADNFKHEETLKVAPIWSRLVAQWISCESTCMLRDILPVLQKHAQPQGVYELPSCHAYHTTGLCSMPHNLLQNFIAHTPLRLCCKI